MVVERIQGSEIVSFLLEQNLPIKVCDIADENPFLVFVTGRIFMAPVESHAKLMVIHDLRLSDRFAEWLRTFAESDDPDGILKTVVRDRRHALIGAGVADKTGKVFRWNSFGFDLETPPYLRAEVSRSIAHEFAGIPCY